MRRFLLLLSLAVMLTTTGLLARRLLQYRNMYHQMRTERQQLGDGMIALQKNYDALLGRIYPAWRDRSLPILPQIAEDIRSQRPATRHDLIVAVRKYVSGALAAVYDDWYREHSRDLPATLAAIYRRRHDPQHAPLASLDCYPVCLAASSILNYLELPCRHVAFFTDDFDEVRSHACLEVYNSETKSWELHDVLWDLHFCDKATGGVLDAAQLVFSNLDQVVPTDGARTGWATASPRGDASELRHYYDAIAYADPGRRQFVMVNTRRASVDTTFAGNGHRTLLEFLNQRFNCPTIVSLQASDLKMQPPVLDRRDVEMVRRRTAEPMR